MNIVVVLYGFDFMVLIYHVYGPQFASYLNNCIINNCKDLIS